MRDYPFPGDTVYFLSRQNTPSLDYTETVLETVYERLERGTYEVQTSSYGYFNVRRFPERDTAQGQAWLQLPEYWR